MSREFNLTGTLTEDFGLLLTSSHIEGMRRLLKPLQGKTLEIKLKEVEYKRSDAQNRYYWGVVIPTVRAFLHETEGVRHSKDEVHFYNLYQVQRITPRIKTIMGVDTIIVEAKKSSEMTVQEFMDYVEQLQAYWAEKGCIIPDPQKHNFITDFIQQ